MPRPPSPVVGPFPAFVKPCASRPGLYRRCAPGFWQSPGRVLMWSWWDGEEWACLQVSADKAYAMRKIVSAYQHLPWYGYRKG